MDQKNSVRLQEEVTLTGIAIHGVKLLAFLNQQTAGNTARLENPAIHEGIDRDVFALIKSCDLGNGSELFSCIVFPEDFDRGNGRGKDMIGNTINDFFLRCGIGLSEAHQCDQHRHDFDIISLHTVGMSFSMLSQFAERF